MVIRKKTIARKYACAYLNLYFDAIADEHIKSFCECVFFLKNNRGILYYLNLPFLTQDVWDNFIKQFYLQFKLPDQFKRLMDVLLKARRITLLPLVIESLLNEFWKRKHVIHFVVKSSHELTDIEQKNVILFLKKKIGASEIIAQFFVEPSLICGIQIKSNMYMFEHSVARELKEIKESLLQRAQL